MRHTYIFSLPPLAATVATTAAIALAAPVAAQNAPSTVSPRTIIVQSYNLPKSPGADIFGSVVVTPERLDEMRDASLETLLRDVAGFQQFRRSDSRSNNPTAQGITLRALGGNAASRAAITLDGVPLTDPFFGYIPFNAINPQDLGSITLVRGTDIGAFGAGMTGTVALESAKPGVLAPIELLAMTGDNALRELSGVASTMLGSGYLSVSGRYAESTGFNTTPKDQHKPFSTNARYDNWATSAHVAAPINDTLMLQGRLAAFHDERTLRFKGANSMNEGQDASLRLIADGIWKVEALAYLQARRFSMVTVSASSGKAVLNQRAVPSTGVGAKLELRPPLKNNALRLGVDWRRADGTMDEYSVQPTGEWGERRQAGGQQTVVGGFLSYDPEVGPLTGSFGARVEHWTIRNSFFERTSPALVTTEDTLYPERSGTAFTARAGLMAQLVEGWRLRGALSTGYRLPTLNELYRPYSIFPVSYRANPDLAPERLLGAEAGVDGHLGPISLSATFFANRLKHAITNVTIGTNLRQRQNVPAIVTKGVELQAGAHFGDFVLASSLAFSDAHVDAPGLAFDNMRPAQVPKLALNGTLSWRPKNGLRASVTLHHISTQYEDDRMQDALPGYLTADARLRIPLGAGVALVARLDNVFNKEYWTRNQAGSIDYGAGRLFAVGFSFGERPAD